MHDTITVDEARSIIVDQSHTIADLLTELGRYKRANRQAVDMLADAAHALGAGQPSVTLEYVDRTIADLAKAARA